MNILREELEKLMREHLDPEQVVDLLHLTTEELLDQYSYLIDDHLDDILDTLNIS